MQTFSYSSKAKLYFASDFHLGVPDQRASQEREIKIVKWLESISHDADAIFLVGDLFDFWFEYKKVIPKGFVRFTGKVAELVDRGIPIYFFRGNHDLWMEGYFNKEIGVTVLKEPIIIDLEKIRIFVGHGDGLGPGDHKFKLIKKIFNHRISKWFFRWLHPDIGVWLAHKWSSRSRVKGLNKDRDQLYGENEWLLQYARSVEAKEHFDYFIFGHRHIAMEQSISEQSSYINLGEWVYESHYCVVEDGRARLVRYEN